MTGKKETGYCGICGRKYGFRHAPVTRVEITEHTCNVCNVFLQKTRPEIKPTMVTYFLPFLKIKKKIGEVRDGISQVTIQKKVDEYQTMLGGKRIRESTREIYARILAIVAKRKHITSKELGTTFGVPPSKSAFWLERLRTLQLLGREKAMGPTRMVWYYSLT